MSDEDFKDMFGEDNLDNIEMDVALDSVVSLYVGLRKKGLHRKDAALLVAALVHNDNSEPNVG